MLRSKVSSGWLTAPLTGAGSANDPIRPLVADREAENGDRLENVIGNRDRCLVAYNVADDSNLGDWGGQKLLDLDELKVSAGQVHSVVQLDKVARSLRVGSAGSGCNVLRRIGRALDLNFNEGLHLGNSLAPQPGSFVDDSFTDADATLLQNHIGEVGATWTKHTSYSADAQSAANRIYGNSVSLSTAYYASGVPATSEYDVMGTIYFTTVANDATSSGFAARMATGANTMYLVRYRHDTTDWRIEEISAGTFTTLATWTNTESAATTATVTLEVRNAAKKLYIAGTERASTTSNVITGAGRPGVRLFNGTPTTGHHLGLITATDAPVAGAGGRRMLMGVG